MLSGPRHVVLEEVLSERVQDREHGEADGGPELHFGGGLGRDEGRRRHGDEHYHGFAKGGRVHAG